MINSGIFLLLGSNEGDREAKLGEAISLIEKSVGPITRQSSMYETAAWGKADQRDFYNQVIEIKSGLEPEKLLAELLSIENRMGRVRTEKWGPRAIDIDILFYNNVVIDRPDLRIPHPGIPHRRFTLVPLSELSPSLIHPALGKSVSEMLENCKDTLEVRAVSSTR
jgi:2-amino-4-hydroxy-6-hydroxymethyldihydropteridine diphosphokinase